MTESNLDYYPLARLNDEGWVIENLLVNLPELRKTLNDTLANKSIAKSDYDELKKCLSGISKALGNSYFILLELEIPNLSDYTLELKQAVDNFPVMTPDYSKFISVIRDYLKELAGIVKTTDARIIGRLMNIVKMGYYPTDPEHVKILADKLRFPAETITNLFDPCCGCGIALRTLAEGNGCYTYGAEIDQERAKEAQTRLHRVAMGSYYYSQISKESFHGIFLNPPYLIEKSSLGSTRTEKRFLVESLNHLMPDGLLIYVIPYYRLTPDIARILVDNFRDITVWKFLKPEFSKHKQVFILGIKQKRINGEELVEDIINQVGSLENIQEISDLPVGAYALPDIPKKVDKFMGHIFNKAELTQQLIKSSSLKKLMSFSPLDDRKRQPPLPLAKGQIGLVGASGALNGFINDERYPHVIKGRIVPHTKVYKDNLAAEDGTVEIKQITETNAHKMVFKVLTQNGVKSLA